jgi:hypothetical protein
MARARIADAIATMCSHEAPVANEGFATRDGEGRKGEPYRYRRILRNAAAQHPRGNAEESGWFLLRPRSGQQNETDDSTEPRSIRRAETEPTTDDLPRLDDLATRYPEAA